jgi:hypothetical protein
MGLDFENLYGRNTIGNTDVKGLFNLGTVVIGIGTTSLLHERTPQV